MIVDWEMKDQALDNMDLEWECGIIIKSYVIQMYYDCLSDGK